jgi:Holliday junction DNA helicase RuvB
MNFYNTSELSQIVTKASNKLNKDIDSNSALEIARRSRGTPRISLRLLKRVRDFSDVADETSISHQRTQFALNELGINNHGFDEMDIRFLRYLIEAKGRPMGLSTIAAALSEDEGTIEDVVEPYLLANGYLERTSRGRIATAKTYDILKFALPNNNEANSETNLFS